MGWRLNAINRHKDDIARARETIEQLQTGQLDIGDVLPDGWLESRKSDLIAHYERVSQELAAIVARLEWDWMPAATQGQKRPADV